MANFIFTLQLTWELQKIQIHNFTAVPGKPFVMLPAASPKVSHLSPVPQTARITQVISEGPKRILTGINGSIDTQDLCLFLSPLSSVKDHSASMP